MKWKKMSIPSRKNISKKCPMTSLLKLKFLGQFTLRPEILLRVTQKCIQEVQEAFRRPKMTLKPPRTRVKLAPEGPYLVNQSHY